MKLAYADVYRYNADPRSSRVPVAELLSKDYARERAKLIDPKRANGTAGHGCPAGSDTIYLTVVDREGNIASWIQSIYASFGSGITVEGMGFELQTRAAGFTLERGHPHVLVGGKRPFHTIIPGAHGAAARTWASGYGRRQPAARSPSSCRMWSITA
jgi:gamma-glutamyltranspeptidase/glutathione hydrolase